MSEVDCSYRIYGLVQGVGFRPFVSELASKKGVSGYVRNDGGIVYARFIGDKEAVESILDRLLALKKKNRYLPGAVVDRIEKIELTEQIETALKETPPLFPGHAVVACQGVEGSYQQLACERLFKLPNIFYFASFGAVFSALAWVVFSFFFSLFISSSIYTTYYGSLAAIAVFMMWLYGCFYILLLGANLNHSLYFRNGSY